MDNTTAALIVSIGALVVDVMILAWLVFTWFYEGHHRRCKVEVTCPSCGDSCEVGCHAGNGHEREGRDGVQ